MEEFRVNPEDILRKIKRDDLLQNRGHLKIFFGYAAGVGKTYAMLKAARAAQSHGTEVVVGYVEPHTRPQTTALLEGLTVLPSLVVIHKGIGVKEFDLDAAIAKKPKLVLVDELAHTNAQSCRHKKRYQDIEELLKAGIDVYTTVNVQHIESLNDMVASITGVIVRERIPDHVFDNAEQVELVDIEPEELIERLQRGKIYAEHQAESALQNFFTLENLVALREIALRRCADRVNKWSEKARAAQNSDYYTEEHILVCLSSSPTNTKTIRAAARMASAFKGNFTALFVETADFPVMSDENKNRLRENMHLAEQLGAVIETVCGDDVAFQISEFARLSGISKIILGRNNVRRKYLFGKPSLIERLTLLSPNLDIYIIPDRETPFYKERKQKPQKFKLVASDIVKSILLLAAATGLGFVFFGLGFSESTIITIYILSVLITSIITTQRVYSLLSSVVSVLTFNFFFTVPRFSFNAYDSGYPVTFLIMFIAAFITGTLAVKIQLHAKRTAQIAFRTKILLDTNRMLQQAKGREHIVSLTANQLTKLLEKDIVFYSTRKDTLEFPTVFSASGGVAETEYTTENERAVATWVYKNNKHAGSTTNTLGNAKCLYLAVRVSDTVYGVIGIALEGEALDSFENSITLSILGECALALENEQVSRDREEAAILAKNEQLRANLLRSISHDLRTPLTSISGNAGILLASDDSIDPAKKKELYTNIYDDSLWLINLVENLLSVTRIEDGTMRIHCKPELIEEIIAEALGHIDRKSGEHKMIVVQEEELLLAKMDARLIVQVIINIVDNAIKYTPVGSEITIATTKKSDKIQVSISDNGEGISEEAKEKIFEMFYTASPGSSDSRRGLGLGLALCKSIVVAHGGEIFVRDHLPRGVEFCFTLPSEEVPIHE